MSIPPLYDESDYEALREEKDKRIAELEQKYEAMLSLHNDEMHRREQAEAEGGQ